MTYVTAYFQEQYFTNKPAHLGLMSELNVKSANTKGQQHCFGPYFGSAE